MQSFPAAQLQGATLIVPVVAIGNTAQLSVDLLINTLQLQRVARLHDPSLLPAVGCKPYEHVPGLATAMELYQAAGSNVAVVQQRAAAAPGTQDAFGQSFAAFLKQSGVKEVFVLGSIEAGIRRDSQLVGLQLRCWAPESDANAGPLQSCRGSAPGGVPQLEADFWQDRALPQRQLPPWPLLRALQQQGVPCAALLSFTTEADNLGDAFQLASAAAAAAGLQAGSGSSGAAAQPQWQAPSSWQYLGGGAAGAVY